MANCCDMKEGDVYTCEACGLELKVTKPCSCTAGSEDACSVRDEEKVAIWPVPEALSI